jgi:RNA polymerase sigma-70 factor (ECF subfamily)
MREILLDRFAGLPVEGAAESAGRGVGGMAESDGGASPRYNEFIREFTRNSRRIYGYIRTLAPDVNDANEVYQNASLVLWNKFEAFSPGGNFFSWACQIAMFEVRKLRETKNRARVFSEESLEWLSDEYQRRDDNSAPRVEALHECLDSLNPKDRALINERYYHERKPTDLAVDLKCSLASVYRALARIHHHLMICVERKLS